MIYVLEGPNFSGKTTVAWALGKQLELPVFTDPGRHGLVPVETPRDWVVQGLQSAVDIAAFSNQFRFVVDRWVLTNMVYDARRGVEWPDGTLRRVINMANAWVYFLDVEPAELLRRSRGDRPELRTLEDARELAASYRLVTTAFAAAGGRVNVVNGNNPVGEVVDEILRV